MKFNMSVLDTATDGLDQLEADILAKVLRPAAHAGALEIYDEARLLVPVKSGLLKSSIYRKHIDDESSDTRQVYRISWNKKTAPHGHLVEYGTSKAAASPFMRPAYDAKAASAVARMQARAREKFAEVTAGQVGVEGYEE